MARLKRRLCCSRDLFNSAVPKASVLRDLVAQVVNQIGCLFTLALPPNLHLVFGLVREAAGTFAQSLGNVSHVGAFPTDPDRRGTSALPAPFQCGCARYAYRRPGER